MKALCPDVKNAITLQPLRSEFYILEQLQLEMLLGSCILVDESSPAAGILW